MICLNDGYSHSLCTVEFIAIRQSYEWIWYAVDVHKPSPVRVRSGGRSPQSAKLLALVKEGYIFGWDDPRLYTLVALRRRGVPADAILSIVGGLGVSTASSNFQLARFDHAARSK